MKQWHVCFVVAALITTSRPVRAQPSNKVLAKQHFVLGKKYFNQGRYDKATEAFKKARRYAYHPVIDFNIALAYAFWHKPIPAARHLRLYLKRVPTATASLPPILQQVQRQTGVLVVQYADRRAAILVDGRRLGHGRVEVILRPGKHRVVIRLRGKTIAHRTLKVPAGGEKAWEVTRLPAVPPRRPQRPPPSARKPKPRTPRAPPPRRRSKIHWALFVTTAVVAAAAAGAAIGLGVQTVKINDDYLATQTDGALRNKGLTYQRITNAMWGMAAVAAATATVLMFFTRWRGGPEKSNPAVTLTPALGPGQVGLSVQMVH